MNDIKEGNDLNRDPLTGTPGSHPWRGVGGVAGGAAAVRWPHHVRPDRHPDRRRRGRSGWCRRRQGRGRAHRSEGETEYWRNEHKTRPYVDATRDYDRDYAPAYGFGLQAREKHAGRSWDDAEGELQQSWNSARDTSSLAWDEARGAVRDSWDRADRTYGTYEDSDKYFASRFENASYRSADESFDDYRPAYRYGTQTRTRYADRDWDDTLENELKEGWEKTKGTSRLTWERAKNAVKDAFSSHDEYSRYRRS